MKAPQQREGRGLLEQNGLNKITVFSTQSLNVFMDLRDPMLIIWINKGVKNKNHKIINVCWKGCLYVKESSLPHKAVLSTLDQVSFGFVQLSNELGSFTVSLGNMFQCCAILMVKICFLKSSWYLPGHKFMSLSPESTEKRLTLSCFALLFKQLQADIRSSLIFHFTRLNKLISPHISSKTVCSRSLPIFVAHLRKLYAL